MVEERRQPQEKGPIESFIEEKKRHEEEFLNRQDQNLPQEIVAKATEKMSSFQELKSEIGTNIVKVTETLEVIRKIIENNICDQAHEDGLLTQGKEEYLACLELKYEQMELLLRKDEAQWAENIEVAHGKAAKIKEQIKELLSNQNRQLEELLEHQAGKQMPARPKPRFNLRRLPFWGQARAQNDLDFEWPTKEQIDQMPADLRLQSLEFKMSQGKQINSVRVNLTHGYSSGTIEKQDDQFSDHQTIEFDVDRPVKRVLGADQNGTLSSISAIKFMDKACKQVNIYDPSRNLDRYLGQMHQLEDNEELIGIYGKKDEQAFTSLGFIAKVRENN